jgi:hypothetical protein
MSLQGDGATSALRFCFLIVALLPNKKIIMCYEVIIEYPVCEDIIYSDDI